MFRFTSRPLRPGREPPIHIGQEAGWAQSRRERRSEEKILYLTGTRIPARRCSDCATVAPATSRPPSSRIPVRSHCSISSRVTKYQVKKPNFRETSLDTLKLIEIITGCRNSKKRLRNENYVCGRWDAIFSWEVAILYWRWKLYFPSKRQ
jgi:hypothetical protein